MIKFKDKQTMIRFCGVLVVALLAGYVFFSTVKGIMKTDNETTQSNLQQSKINKTPVVLTGQVQNTQEAQEVLTTMGLASYVVKKGDTLYSISRQYFDNCPEIVAVKTLIKSNNITDPSNINVGASLIVPANYLSSGSVHTIEKGDTLYSIARSYFVDVDVKTAVGKLMKDNFLDSDELNVGDKLFITVETLE